MSKAFTRESDDLPEKPVLARPLSALPAGAKNYLTPAGEKMLREELERLVQSERPRLAQSDPAARGQLQSLDQRIEYLRQSLSTAEIVPRPSNPEERVRFGATIKVRDEAGSESTYRIVGIDETDIDKGWVSWLSPIAKAMVNARAGQRVRFKSPSGEQILEIVHVSYE
jgi:transcription elongation factor GreB